MAAESAFVLAFRGGFSGILRWPQLDALWETIRQQNDGQWYLYAVGEAPPSETSSRDEVETFVQEVDQLLRREHEEDYCGLVYCDNIQAPQMIKIYDPHGVGTSCGSGLTPSLPAWVMSRLAPTSLEAAFPPPGNRRRWWRKLFK